jgi:transcription antitermination factor NusG
MFVQRSYEESHKWYVAYTFPKAEKKAQSKLAVIGIQSYLPMHQTLRNWSDRKKKLVVPLFPNYLFVHISDKKRHETFSVKEIVRYVSFEGKPATINDSIIDSLKNILKEDIDVTVESFFKAGDPVIITRGPFMGTEGIIVNRNGKSRLIIQIASLQCSVAINISARDVVVLNESILS